MSYLSAAIGQCDETTDLIWGIYLHLGQLVADRENSEATSGYLFGYTFCVVWLYFGRCVF